MMPDLQQVGEGQTQQWAPNTTVPVVLLENVSKTYGKIHALSEITLAFLQLQSRLPWACWARWCWRYCAGD